MSGTRRRSVLAVPGSEPTKIVKALASPADEVIVDLEDAVAVDAKDAARDAVAGLRPRERGGVAVRVKAAGTRWHDDDLAACAANPAIRSVVLPKAECPDGIRMAVAALGDGTATVQALVESPLALTRVAEIAAASPRLAALVIGYADLSASLGRRLDAPWQFARDLVLVAARAAGVQAIDGPYLHVTDDEAFAESVDTAVSQGFDGKWVIHPRQIARVNASFAPTQEEVDEAEEILRVMADAERSGLGAVSWRGRMLDEALVTAARRVVSRVEKR